MNLNRELIQELLLNEVSHELDERPKTGEKRKFAFYSPFCNDTEKKCVMWFPSGRFRCYKSGEEGDFFKFIKLIKNLNSYSEAKYYFIKNYLKSNDLIKNFINRETQDFEEKEVDEIKLPEGSEKFNKLKHIKYFNYLKDRELSSETIDLINLFIEQKTQRIIFPIYSNDNSKLLYYTGRSIDKNQKLRWVDAVSKHKSEVVFSLNKNLQTIYLVEGIFDSLKIDGGVSLLGSYLHETIEKELISKNYYKIIVVMDNDLPGLEAQLKIILKLKKKRNVYIWNWNNEKINKYKDFGEIPLSILNELKLTNYYKADDKGILKWKLLNIKKFEMEKRLQLNRLIKYGY
jgi:hypothetical protein